MTENTEKSFSFTVEGEPFDVGEKQLTAKRIIEMAQKKGIEPARDQIEKLTLKSENAVYQGDDLVDLLQAKAFTIGVVVYKFLVNGQELESNLKKLAVSKIVEIAQKNGVALPGTPENLLLSAVGQKQHEFNAEDQVDLGQFNEFLLILNEPTPVA